MLLSRSNFDQLGQKETIPPEKRVGICFKRPGGGLLTLKGKLKRISKNCLIVFGKSTFFWRLSIVPSVFRAIPLLCLWLTAGFKRNMSNVRLGPRQL